MQEVFNQPPVPEITICPSVFISGEEIMYLEGTALKNSQVLIFFKQNEKLIKEWQVISNDVGEWTLIEDRLFKDGFYQITAKTKDAEGIISDESQPCLIKVILSGVAVGNWTINYKTLAIILLIIFILVLIVIFYILARARQTKKVFEREAKDLKQKFYKEYQELEVDIEKHFEYLKTIKEEGEFTEIEKKKEEALFKNLADVKRVFETELKDIEKELE